jgi:hypothetical protein
MWLKRLGDAFGSRCCPFGVEPVPVSSKASITIAGHAAGLW